MQVHKTEICLFNYMSSSIDKPMFFFQLLGQVNVLLLRFILTHSLLRVPCIPFGFALHVKHSWSLGVDITNSSLLVECVHLLQFIIAQRLIDLVADIVNSLLKIFLGPISAICTLAGQNYKKKNPH